MTTAAATKIRTGLATQLVALFLGAHAGLLGACPPLTSPEAMIVATTANRIFATPLNLALSVSDQSTDPNTCWMQITLSSPPPAPVLRRVLFLSPDRKVLATQVYDMSGSDHRPLAFGPARVSGFLPRPNTRPSRAWGGFFWAGANPGSISLRNGSSIIDASATVLTSPNAETGPIQVIFSFERPSVIPAGIRLVSPAGFTTHPIDLELNKASNPVHFPVATSPTNSVAGTVSVTVRVVVVSPAAGRNNAVFGDNGTSVVTVKVGPQ